jgi:hypothetical protein
MSWFVKLNGWASAHGRVKVMGVCVRVLVRAERIGVGHNSVTIRNQRVRKRVRVSAEETEAPRTEHDELNVFVEIDGWVSAHGRVKVRACACV